MNVILVEGSVSIKFMDTGKEVQVDNKVISAKLSEVPSMETMLFLMRLPYIKEISYSKKNRTVSYAISENREYIYDADESIIKVFDWCDESM